MSHSAKTVVITGGAGFIGSKLTAKLISLGYRVIVIDNRRSDINLQAVFYHADIVTDDMTAIFKKENPFCVFHLAGAKSVTDSAKQPKLYEQVNTIGSKRVFDAAQDAHVTRIIFTSTAGVYGDSLNGKKQIESDALNPSSLYAQTKLEAEHYFPHIIKNGVEGIILRLANVYGADNHIGENGVVDKFIKALKSKTPIDIYGDGSQTRDFIYIEDVIDAMILAMKVDYKKIPYPPIINISSGRSVSILDLIEILATQSMINPKIIYHRDVHIGQRDSILDPSCALAALGWHAQTSLETWIIKAMNVSH